MWGAVIAAGAAYLINTLLGLGVYVFTSSEAITQLTTGSLIAPVVEECLKGLAVLAVFFLFYSEFDSILDGIIYASITALGFAATENVYYIYTMGYLEEEYAGLLAMSFVRVFLVGWQHPFYTSFIGIGLAVTRMSRNIYIKIAAPIAGWSIAVIAHALHNTLAQLLRTPGGLVFSTLVDWTGWLFIFLVIIIAIQNEKHHIVLQLKDEVQLGTLTAAQYRTASSTWSQGMATITALTSGRYLSTRRFYQLAAELAHKKRQLGTMGEEDGNSHTIKKLRTEMAALANQAQA
jgi:RsiW-degrading membrane proteinase PrsW (M82 family)